MEHSATAYRHSQEAHQESESSVNETGKNVHTASGPSEADRCTSEGTRSAPWQAGH